MKQSQLIWIVTFTITVIILGWAAFAWIGATNYHPVTPERNPLIKYNYQTKPSGWQLSRYQRLLEGGPFFEKPPTAPAPKNEFYSDLIIYGIVKGNDSRAIVGLEEDSGRETWIVKPGSVVEEETIVAIGANYIEVRNGSGTGKVFLRE